jgi:ferredoxin
MNSPMKVQVDENVCAGFGHCNQRLPEVFDLNDIGFSVVQGDGTVPLELEDLAHLAIVSCPTHAISEVHSNDPSFPNQPMEA